MGLGAGVLAALALAAGPPAHGVNLTAYQRDGYRPAAVAEALDDARDAGARQVAIVTTWYVDDLADPTVEADPGRTPTDASIIATIRAARDRGMTVLLKPHVDVLDGSFRGDLQPADPAVWWGAYEEMIDHYARLAQEAGADALVVGVELRSLSRDADAFARIIASAREHFDGALTYAANWDEVHQVGFWRSLDMIGVDAYYPLADRPGEGVPELRAAWAPHIARLEALSERVGRPVLITELGYAARPDAAVDPAGAGSSPGPFDVGAQRRAYEAAVAAWDGVDWLRGILWWDWPVDARDHEGAAYTPRDRPAEELLDGAPDERGPIAAIAGAIPWPLLVLIAAWAAVGAIIVAAVRAGARRRQDGDAGEDGGAARAPSASASPAAPATPAPPADPVPPADLAPPSAAPLDDPNPPPPVDPTPPPAAQPTDESPAADAPTTTHGPAHARPAATDARDADGAGSRAGRFTRTPQAGPGPSARDPLTDLGPPDVRRVLDLTARVLGADACEILDGDAATAGDRAWPAMAETPLLVRGRLLGALAVGRRDRDAPFDQRELELLAAMSELVAAALAAPPEARWPTETVRGQLEALAGARGGAADERQRGLLGVALARHVGERLLPDDRRGRAELVLATRLHDVGMLRVPRAPLRRPGPLGPADAKLVESHPAWGSEIISGIPGLASVAAIVRFHQERPDGRGYPHRLAGPRIPPASLAVGAIAAWAAIVAGGPHAPRRSPEHAVDELRRHAGTQFDAAVVEAIAAASPLVPVQRVPA